MQNPQCCNRAIVLTEAGIAAIAEAERKPIVDLHTAVCELLIDNRIAFADEAEEREFRRLVEAAGAT